MFTVTQVTPMCKRVVPCVFSPLSLYLLHRRQSSPARPPPWPCVARAGARVRVVPVGAELFVCFGFATHVSGGFRCIRHFSGRARAAARSRRSLYSSSDSRGWSCTALLTLAKRCKARTVSTALTALRTPHSSILTHYM